MNWVKQNLQGVTYIIRKLRRSHFCVKEYLKKKNINEK